MATSSHSDTSTVQLSGIGRFTRRAVFCSSSATVKRSDGNGLRSGECRSKRGRTPLAGLVAFDLNDALAAQPVAIRSNAQKTRMCDIPELVRSSRVLSQ